MAMHLYPVKTTTDGNIVRNLRLRSTEDGTVVWRFDKATGEVNEFVRVDGQPERVGATQNWRVGELVFEPQRGCGCNHPMYTWVPPED
jgi:hypothetical protein